MELAGRENKQEKSRLERRKKRDENEEIQARSQAAASQSDKRSSESKV